MRATNLTTRKSKTCDDCKRRKVRCTVPAGSDGSKCFNCVMRDAECHFSQGKRRLRPKVGELDQSSRSTDSPAQFSSASTAINVETPSSILNSVENTVFDSFQAQDEESLTTNSSPEPSFISGQCKRSLLVTNGVHPSSSGLATLSDSRIESLSRKLGHTLLQDVMRSLGETIQSRIAVTVKPWPSTITKAVVLNNLCSSREKHALYFNAYFRYFHPQFPFLDQKAFEECAKKTDLDQYLQHRPEFAALYFSIVALGSLCTDGGAFKRGEGTAWTFFQASQELVPVISSRQHSLCGLQALVALTIFAQTSSAIELGDLLISEMARMALMMRLNRLFPINEYGQSCARTFWVVYKLETLNAFACNRCSMIAHYDIATPLLPTPNDTGFDWFYSMVSLARLLSTLYKKLFSVAAAVQTSETTKRGIELIREDLEKWRLSIPETMRPGSPITIDMNNGVPLQMVVRMHCHFYAASMALLRAEIHHLNESDAQLQMRKAIQLVHTARMIAETTKYIDIKPHAPVWLLAIVPLSAIFVLFDFIVYNPFHDETNSSLKALGIIGGHYHQLDYFSKGMYPSDPISDLVDMAKRHVSQKRSGTGTENFEVPAAAQAYQFMPGGSTQMDLTMPYFTQMSMPSGLFDCEIPVDWGGNSMFSDFSQGFSNLPFVDQNFTFYND